MSDKPHGHDNPLTQLWVSMSGASSGHHETPPGLEEKSVAVGHEPDRFGIGGIIAVPIAVALALLITYATVTLIFRFVNSNSSNAIASNDVPINDRLGRISSAGGDAAAGVPQQASGEPRLDGLPKINTGVNGKDLAPYVMSYRQTPVGNWPDIYPEDLRPENFVEYGTQRRPLVDPPEVIAGNAAYARLPIATAVDLLATNDALRKQYLPTAETPLEMAHPPTAEPKASNGGQVTTPKAPAAPAAPKAKDH